MEEIMAKSKKAKAEKTKQREEDLDAIEALDKDLAELAKSEGFQSLLRPKGVKQKGQASANADDAAFDILRRELVFEAKGKVSPERIPSWDNIRIFTCRLTITTAALYSAKQFHILAKTPIDEHTIFRSTLRY